MAQTSSLDRLKSGPSLDEKKEALVAIKNNPSIKTPLSFETDAIATWVDRKVGLSTNGFMVLLLLIEIMSLVAAHSYFFIHKITGLSEISFQVLNVALVTAIPLSAFPVLMALRALFLRASCRSWHPTDKLIKDTIGDDHDRKLGFTRRTFLRYWQRLLFISPFAYKYIWWWSLVASIAAVMMETFAQLRDGTSEHPLDVGVSLLKAFLIAILAYIATNIIRELLALRSKYVEAQQSAGDLRTVIDDCVGQMRSNAGNMRDEMQHNVGKMQEIVGKVQDIVPKAVDTLTAALSLAESQIGLKGLAEEINKASGSESAFQGFTQNLSAQVNNFCHQLREVEDNVIKLLILSVLNQCIADHNSILNTSKKHLLVRFSTLAKTAEQIVNASKNCDNIEYYASLAIPPAHFLNKTRGEAVGDSDWEGYLNSNIINSLAGVKQKRYFLSIDKIDQYNNLSSEARLLAHEIVNSQLRSRVQASETENQPGWRAGTKRLVPVANGTGASRKYVIEEDGPATWPTLADVLDATYHAPSCCFVREFNSAQFEELMTDQETRKPYDYYAVRRNGDWTFCLESRYDKDLDVADMQIYHGGMKESPAQGNWPLVKMKLDRIFVTGTNQPRDGRIRGIAGLDAKPTMR
jgi:hypothetical protein